MGPQENKTGVDRATRCIIGHLVVPQRSFEIFQDVVDQGPRAEHYSSDGLAAYADVYSHGAPYAAMRDKSQTFSVKVTMRRCAITLLGCIGVHVVFPKVSKPCAAR